jgi:hypothetical protein
VREGFALDYKLARPERKTHGRCAFVCHFHNTGIVELLHIPAGNRSHNAAFGDAPPANGVCAPFPLGPSCAGAGIGIDHPRL